VLVTSHIDVVPPYIPYHISDTPSYVTSSTAIRGRGSVDAKASVAAQITAVEELLNAEEIDWRDVMLLFVVGEEVNGDGMRHFSSAIQQLHPPLEFDAVIFGEPTQNKLACGHKGHMTCSINARGKAGHSGYPWLGKSATAMLVNALDKILETNLGSSDRFGNTTVNIGILEGGVAANVIPEKASAQLAIRVATGTQSTGSGAVKKKVEEILAEVDPDLSMECDDGYGVVECDCEVDGECGDALQSSLEIPRSRVTFL
jgi:acetylornithine deacetylase